MSDEAATSGAQVRAAEVVAALSLAIDLGSAVPLEHGLHSTLFAMRLCDHLGVDTETAVQTYYACLLFYVGCTANADIAAQIFGEDDALTTYSEPLRFGSQVQMMTGMLRAVAPPGGTPLVRAKQVARGVPRLLREFKVVIAAVCEVAQMLSERLGLQRATSALFAHIGERWDGKGEPGQVGGSEIPLPMRIVHVSRDAAIQRLIGGSGHAAEVVHDRAGGAFDPAIATALADDAATILTVDADRSAWNDTLALEPTPQLLLTGEQVDDALRAMGDFADLVSPYLLGHSAGVAQLAAAAARRCGLDVSDQVAVRRAGLVHDLGRVAVPARVWQTPAPLSADDWERVRLHAYHTERILIRSPYLTPLAAVATSHHERLDGSGYHRGTTAPALTLPTRIVAAADAYHAMIEPRAHRAAHTPAEAAALIQEEARTGRLDADAVSGVLAAAGQPAPSVARPAGLTERESEVVGLLARGLQTKQIARRLDISTKTADRHIQNSYRKMGVSTRAAAALFAMHHGLVTLTELPFDTHGPTAPH